MLLKAMAKVLGGYYALDAGGLPHYVARLFTGVGESVKKWKIDASGLQATRSVQYIPAQELTGSPKEIRNAAGTQKVPDSSSYPIDIKGSSKTVSTDPTACALWYDKTHAEAWKAVKKLRKWRKYFAKSTHTREAIGNGAGGHGKGQDALCGVFKDEAPVAFDRESESMCREKCSEDDSCSDYVFVRYRQAAPANVPRRAGPDQSVQAGRCVLVRTNGPDASVDNPFGVKNENHDGFEKEDQDVRAQYLRECFPGSIISQKVLTSSGSGVSLLPVSFTFGSRGLWHYLKRNVCGDAAGLPLKKEVGELLAAVDKLLTGGRLPPLSLQRPGVQAPGQPAQQPKATVSVKDAIGNFCTGGGPPNADSATVRDVVHIFRELFAGKFDMRHPPPPGPRSSAASPAAAQPYLPVGRVSSFLEAIRPSSNWQFYAHHYPPRPAAPGAIGDEHRKCMFFELQGHLNSAHHHAHAPSADGVDPDKDHEWKKDHVLSFGLSRQGQDAEGLLGGHAYTLESFKVLAFPVYGRSGDGREQAQLQETPQGPQAGTSREFLLVYAVQIRNPHAGKDSGWNPVRGGKVPPLSVESFLNFQEPVTQQPGPVRSSTLNLRTKADLGATLVHLLNVPEEEEDNDDGKAAQFGHAAPAWAKRLWERGGVYFVTEKCDHAFPVGESSYNDRLQPLVRPQAAGAAHLQRGWHAEDPFLRTIQLPTSSFSPSKVDGDAAAEPQVNCLRKYTQEHSRHDKANSLTWMPWAAFIRTGEKDVWDYSLPPKVEEGDGQQPGNRRNVQVVPLDKNFQEQVPEADAAKAKESKKPAAKSTDQEKLQTSIEKFNAKLKEKEKLQTSIEKFNAKLKEKAEAAKLKEYEEGKLPFFAPMAGDGFSGIGGKEDEQLKEKFEKLKENTNFEEISLERMVSILNGLQQQVKKVQNENDKITSDNLEQLKEKFEQLKENRKFEKNALAHFFSDLNGLQQEAVKLFAKVQEDESLFYPTEEGVDREVEISTT